MPVGAWVIATSDIFDDVDANNRRAAKVTVSGSGTATLSKAPRNRKRSGSAVLLFPTTGLLRQTFTSVTTSQVDANEQLDPAPVSGLGSNNLALRKLWKRGLTGRKLFFRPSPTMCKMEMPTTLRTFRTIISTINGKFYKPQIATTDTPWCTKHAHYEAIGISDSQVEVLLRFWPNRNGQQFQIGTQLDGGFSPKTQA